MTIEYDESTVKWTHDTNKTLDKCEWKQAEIYELIECWEENHKDFWRRGQKHEERRNV